MLTTLFYITLLVNVFLALINKKSKLVAIFSFLMAYIVLAGGNYNNDYNYYLRDFLSGSYSFTEPGYALLCGAIKALGGNYQTVLILFQLFCLLIIFYILKKLTANYHVFFAMYFSIQFFLDITQVRNYVASTLLALAILLLVFNKKRMAIVMCCIAATFHLTFLVYLPFILWNEKIVHLFCYNSKKIVFTIIGCCGVVLITGNSWLIRSVTNILQVGAGSLFETSKIESYVSSGMRFGGLLFIGLFLANLICIKECESAIAFRESDVIEEDIFIHDNLFNIIYGINVYAAIFLPLIMINMNFYRFYRNLNIINFCFFAYLLTKRQFGLGKNQFFNATAWCVILVLVWVIGLALKGTNLGPQILENNIWI